MPKQLESRLLMNSKIVAAALTLTLGALGCTEPNPAFNPDPLLPGECRAGVEFTETFDNFARPDKLDVLIVVDDSGDVRDLQQGLADALPEFLGPLDDLDIQIAVTTTDGTGAPRLAPPGTLLDGCQGNGDRVARSEASNFVKVAQCNIVQGTEGDPFQQSLGVVRDLFFEASPQDLGFFRSDSRVLVMIVSNEDDCTSSVALGPTQQPRQACKEQSDSLTAVSELVEEYKSLKRTPEGLSIAVISGPPGEASDSEQIRPVCSSGLGAVYGASRLFELTQALGDFGTFENACVEDLRSTLRALATEFVLPETTTLCAAKTMAHEPLSVTAIEADERRTVRLGASGFTYQGQTGSCETGALQFNGLSLADASSVEVTYCVEE